MPTTITTYNSFIAGTKARASEVNQNFSNHRGNLLPIEENTATASNNSHDLGSLSHQWNNLYLNNAPYVNGSQQTVTPTGAILPFAGNSAPSGFFLCDGSAIDRTTYAALFSVIGELYGAGDLSTTFNIPDIRGRFIRSADAGAGRDLDLASRSSSLLLFIGDGNVGNATTTISSLSASIIGRLRTGFRVWGPTNETATQGRIYLLSTTIASIPAAVITTMQPGFRIWGSQVPTTTIISVNTAAASIIIGATTLAATASASFSFDLHLFPTTTIASINTATSSIVIGATTTIATTTASLTFDAGAGCLGSYQLDAFQGHGHYLFGPQGATAGAGSVAKASGPGYTSSAGQIGDPSDTGFGVVRYGNETRPYNIYANHILKY